MYAIVDIETTGGNALRERMTEIAVYIHDGEKIIDEFSSLINPQCNIPPFVARLTGITNELVKTAPKFHEIAKKIVDITKDCTLVAHNAPFDYGFLKQEFLHLGYNYERPVKCTVKLAQKLLPGMPSYSLGNLCKSLNIEISSRHRATGDAYATVKLFEILLKTDPTLSQIPTSGLHPDLDISIFSAIPNRRGVYYLHDKNDKVFYLGKAKNLQTAIYSLFQHTSSEKHIKIRANTVKITYDVLGSELLSALYECVQLDKLKPALNKQKSFISPKYGLYSFKGYGGFLNLHIDKISQSQRAVTTFASMDEASTFLYEFVFKFKLCQKMCGLYQKNGACFQYEKGFCAGNCKGHETVEAYNTRLAKALKSLHKKQKANFYILDEGRDESEISVILIENNVMKGFGYIAKSEDTGNATILKSSIAHFIDCKNSKWIIKHFFMSGKIKEMVFL